MTRARDVADSALVHIHTETFSAVSTVSLNNVFNSSYANYKLYLNLDSGTSNTFITFRLRASGTDNTTTGYNDMRGWDRNTNFTQTSARIALNNNAAEGCAVIDIFRPFEAKVTNAISWFHGRTTDAVDAYNFHATQNQGLSFDGITFLNAGTMTGTIRVYGYRN